MILPQKWRVFAHLPDNTIQDLKPWVTPAEYIKIWVYIYICS